MPKPRPRKQRNPAAVEHLLNTASNDAVDLQPVSPPLETPKPLAKNKRPDYSKLLVYIPENLHKALKREAFESDGELDMSDIVARLLADRYSDI